MIVQDLVEYTVKQNSRFLRLGMSPDGVYTARILTPAGEREIQDRDLKRLEQIVKLKYNLELPAGYRLGESVIAETSGYSLSGSYTDDLVISKIWLAHELARVLKQAGIDSVPAAYVLGSWYGNMSTILRKMGVPIDTIIDVEQNREWSKQGQKIQQAMGVEGVKSMAADANRIDFRKLADPGLVINTSTNDMPDHGWFDHIPEGTIVVLQGRDQEPPGAEHNYKSPEEILELYPLDKVLYQGTRHLQDPETDYDRHMIIGIKGPNQLRELTFMGMSQCTKDCSGHRAGYAWSKQRGGAHAASWSPSFNKGAEIAAAGY
jgi:hypothetical protein